VKIESREGRKKLSVIPMGFNEEKRTAPSVKTLGYFQLGSEYYEMPGMCLAPRALVHASLWQRPREKFPQSER
jgi:hypothetical protein